MYKIVQMITKHHVSTFFDILGVAQLECLYFYSVKVKRHSCMGFLGDDHVRGVSLGGYSSFVMALYNVLHLCRVYIQLIQIDRFDTSLIVRL